MNAQHFTKAPFLPTPEEIGAACQEIQSGWTPEEREKRRMYRLRPQPNGQDAVIAALRALQQREAEARRSHLHANATA